MKEKGFSLIELIIVVVIIGIIAAIAIPNLIAAKRAANEASATSGIRLISSAQETYGITTGNGNYGTLANLLSERLIDDIIGTGQKGGFSFSITKFDSTLTNPAVYNVYANAIVFGITPQASGSKNFYTNEAGVIYENTNGQDNPPDAVSNTDRTVVNGTPLQR